ncbi:MAG: hypothetical protein J7M05_07850 [Anaerolineae bacterium]|nr:hypothetical protein [Anaerolineae bacterium]
MLRSSKKGRTESGLWVEQFCFQGGSWRPAPVNIRVAQAASRRIRKSRGDLYVLIEPPSDRQVPRELYEELLNKITDVYYSLTGSVTRGLRQALLAANEALFEWNLRLDSEHRLLLGLNCAVLREGEIFFAQLGPALSVLVRSGGEAVRYPQSSIWLQSAHPSAFDLDRDPPAGLRRELEPNFFRVNFEPGDVLLLASTSLARLIADPELAALVAQGEDIQQSFGKLAQQEDFCVLLVGWSRAPGQQVARPAPEKKVQQATEPLSVQKEPEERTVPSSESVLARSESTEEEILSAKISPEEEEPAFESSEAVPEEKGAWV